MAQHNEFEDSDQIYRRLRSAPELPFSDLLRPERVARALAALGIKFRERVYSPIATLWVFLSQVLSADHSCRDAVARLLAWRVARKMSPCSRDTASYCEARQKLPLQLIQQLTTDVAGQMEQHTEASWLWKGRHVKIVDGSTVTMPDTPQNQAVYPQSTSQTPGLGFPIARLVVVLSLASGAVLDAALAAMQGKQTGENTLFRGLRQALQPGDVLLADSYFAGFQELATCLMQGVDIVTKQHVTRRTDFRRGRWLGTLDHVVTLSRPKFTSNRFTRAEWEQLPPELQVREIRFRVSQRGFRPREITLVTTLIDTDRYPAKDITALYRERWHCELDLRSLKQSLQMGQLRCKTPDMVQKEAWMHLLAYNLIREVAAEAARKHGALPRRLSFRGTVQAINAFAAYLPRCPQQRQQLWDHLLDAIAMSRVGQRPNRIDPRKLKRRHHKYSYMTHTRNEERRRLCA